MRRATRYLNTDLDLVAKRDLRPLARALRRLGLHALYCGKREDGCWFAVLETDEQFDTPAPNVDAMLGAIEALDAKARALWSSCEAREFHLGFECGDEPRPFSLALPAATLERAAAVGASVRITLYPAAENASE